MRNLEIKYICNKHHEMYQNAAAMAHIKGLPIDQKIIEYGIKAMEIKY